MNKLITLLKTFALDLHESIDWLLWESRRREKMVPIPVRVDER